MNHSNNAFSVLNGSITNVATTITVATGTGSRFPASNFMVTLIGYDGLGNENAWEICLCSSRSGDVLTVVRGRESTTAVAWASATRIENRVTAGTMGNLLYLDKGGTITQPVSITNGAYTAFKVGLTGLVSVGGEAGSAEAKFTVTDGGNAGLEFSPTAIAGANRILSYNRASMAFASMTLMASDIKLNTGGTDRVTLDASGNLTFQPTGSALNNVASVNGGPLAGLRNKIINGKMEISQRGTSFAAVASGAYTLDRWVADVAGTAPTISQQAGSSGYKNCLRITGVAGNTAAGVFQRIESVNVSDLPGKTVTISARLVASGANTVFWSLRYANAVDNFSTQTTIAQGTWSATTTASDFSAVVSGLPAGAANGLQIAFYANNTIAFTSGTLDITGVQLEVGSVATPFEHRPFGMELALCQRYFEKSYNVDMAPGTNATGGLTTLSISSDSGGFALYPIQFRVPKRGTPTITGFTGSGTSGSWSYVRSGASGTATAHIDLVGTSTARLFVHVGAAYTNCVIDGYWTASAEL